jgi:hypothetical protein
MTEQNKQPPAEAGLVHKTIAQSAMPQAKQIAGQQMSQAVEAIDAVAWLVIAKDSDGKVLIRAPFLNENDARGLMQASVNQGGYRASDVSIQQLYTSQTAATQAAVAAAKLEDAGIAESYMEVTDGQSMYIAGKILASIPAEATAALRELLRDAAIDAATLWAQHGKADVNAIADRILAERGLK